MSIYPLPDPKTFFPIISGEAAVTHGTMEEGAGELHVVMLPWLAMGHLLPFFELSKRLALKGIHISFFSSPSNILRLPSIPPSLTPFLNFIPCSLTPIKNLPPNIENTVDLHSETERPLLDQAYAAFEHHLTAFLADPARPKPNWLIYDYAAASWAPALASRFNLNCAFFSLFNAAAIAFLGGRPAYDSPEELTRVPEHIPFSTTVAFRLFEARQIYAILPKKAKKPESQPRSDQLMLIRTCKEFETKWVDLLCERNSQRMPIVPVGFLPPSSYEEEESETWARIRVWLDKREERSVVYAAFGTEARLTREQIDEIGAGLEQSGLPFVWALRVGSPSPPQGFEERTAGRGLVWMDWVPQARVLAHPAVGGFLTHGGWNSVVEGVVVGAVMVVLPMVFDQGLNARHLVETGYAVEVLRNDEDGYFSGEDIGRKLRMVMVEEEGEELRKRARKGKEIFGNEEVQEGYVVELVKHLWEKRRTAADQV